MNTGGSGTLDQKSHTDNNIIIGCTKGLSGRLSLLLSVKGLVDDTCLGRANSRGKLLQRSGGDRLDAAEGGEELVLRLRANPLDEVQTGGQLALAPLVPMEGDGEAMRLGLDILQQV